MEHHAPSGVEPDDGSPHAEAVARLVRRGPQARHELVRLADRGDWRTRVLALGGLGRLIREEAHTGGLRAMVRPFAVVPGLRRWLPTVGSHGRLVSRSIVNATTDHAFVVRAAAALALGECRDAALVARLQELRRDRFRPVRLAASLALVASGRAPDGPTAVDDCEITPTLLAEGVSTRHWLGVLAAGHRTLIESARVALDQPDGAADLVEWLSGPSVTLGMGGVTAEAARYDEEPDLGHQAVKPFGPTGRAENLRQLAALVTLIENLSLPPGATILDLGGGSGWVGELLARFGFRPVVVDVAMPLLGLAADRLAAAGAPGRVLAASMDSLPFGDASIDAAIVLDALHHVGNLSGALAEARRVLVPGGPLLIAEPGEGHAEAPKSLAESREHGIRESEIHPLSLARQARRAGFTRVSVIPQVPSRATMDVAAFERAIAEPSEHWIVSVDGADVPFATLVLRTTLGRPLMMLRAGEGRPDSRAPSVLRAAITPELVRRGGTIEGTITVTNAGDTLWLSATEHGAGTVRVGLQSLDVDGRLIDRDFLRLPLPMPVAPGAACQVRLPPTPAATGPTGTVHLKIDLVAEQVYWFEDRGSAPVYCRL